jgi:prepilin-type processing-associated H-X9-DG protein
MKAQFQNPVTSKVTRLRRTSAAMQAFTRLELVLTLATLMLLALIVLPALGNTKPRAQRVNCVNNLRRIGQALPLWANDHFDQDHWRTDIRDGGTYWRPTVGLQPPWYPLRNNAWFQFAWISNELHTPKILSCPSDSKRVAIDFSANPNGGFLHVSYQNNAVSYFLGLDAFPSQSRSLLAGDRNVRPSAVGVACSTGLDNVAGFNAPPNTNVGWTNAIHGLTGNVLFHDGQVEQLSSRGLTDALGAYGPDDNGSSHYAIPQ